MREGGRRGREERGESNCERERREGGEGDRDRERERREGGESE